jgi:AcrR family transcriptional regulator
MPADPKTSNSSSSRKALTHERIVETAAQAIRRAGFQGTGVADIMKAAGLTHGGFYAHFKSRDALLAEALERAGRDSAERVDRAIERDTAQGASPLQALVDSYLSERHRKHLESGCAVAALACEMPRQAPEVRQAAAARVRGLIDKVRRALPANAPAGSAEAIAAQMMGALQLSRALPDAEGARLLASVRAQLLQQHGRPSPR